MNQVDQQTLTEIRRITYDYFAEECDIDVNELSDETHIITELEGDSLMLLSLLEIFRKKYGLSVELRTLGQHLMKKPADTIGQVIELTTKLVEHGNDIINVAL